MIILFLFFRDFIMHINITIDEMRIIVLLFIYFLLFFNGNCKKEGRNCHRSIQIMNKSNGSIVYALRFYNASNNSKCVLSGSTLAINESYEETLKVCWEDDLTNGRTFEFYIIDPSQYNNPNVFYSCDSIEIKNKVLKHYVLTLDDLKKNDFIITYP